VRGVADPVDCGPGSSRERNAATRRNARDQLHALNFCASGSPCSAAPGNWNAPGTGTGDLANPYANDPNGGSITNLNNVNAPVGTLLPGNGLLFLTFAPSVALPVPDIQFYLTKLVAGVGGTAACGAAPA
jgi:hypothetical protein